VTKADVLPVWGRVLRGYKPFLSIEITKECPLRCPGCYAYEPEHLGGGVLLRQLSDLRGDDLVSSVLALTRRYRPVHLSIVGGEPLARYRELDILLPKLNQMGVEVQLVTSAVRPIPQSWARLQNLHVVVSIDGLRPEHDRRRAPATYDRILVNIAGHRIIVHCTITRQLLARPDYLRDFAAFWSARGEVRLIWFSLFTPQEGEQCEERLKLKDRADVIGKLAGLRPLFPKVCVPQEALQNYLRPPASPQECLFAQMTTCLSADLKTQITPCQFGGQPVCAECGCFASAGLAAVGQHRVAGIRLWDIFAASRKIGERFQWNGNGNGAKPGLAPGGDAGVGASLNAQ
jgi:organic radical activating enzyme